jgi:uncharacterized protein (DUF1501 family)
LFRPLKSVIKPPVRCGGPVRRREFLRAGLLTLGGLGLADVVRGRAAAGEGHRETSVILLYLHGGASQLETYDLKPHAPIEYRSVFDPIATNVPGLDICEHFPLQAQLADKFSLIRSVRHEMSSHSDGGIEVLTGKTPTRPDPTSTSKSEHPDLGAITSRMHGTHPGALPRYVAMPASTYMTRPAYLGVHHGPFVVGDPSAKDFKLPALQLATGPEGAKGLDDRRGLLRQLDKLRADLDLRGSLDGTDQFRERAFAMLTGREVASAFDLSQEDDRLRDRYGRHLWGQSCLLARRLAEAGTSVVSLFIDTPRNGEEFTNWDDHPGNAGRIGHFGVFMKTRLPYLDQALSALIEDIFARGADKRILVAVLGEFGRTPRLRNDPRFGGAGRDHWPDAQSVLLSGGGLKMGQVVGATNSKAEYPTLRPLTPKDVLATIYRHLGIDYTATLTDHSGRPVHILGEGVPIAELV